jgi:DNA-binding LytR/AlgR family response regulator
MMFAYIFIVDFHLGRMEPYASDILFLAIVLYFIVFTGSFILFIRKYNESNVKIQELRKEKELNARGFLEVRSARKKVRIDYELLEYIESYSDYVKIHRTGMDPVMTRKKISHLDDALPESFLRVHRSFIVNSGHITAYNYEKIELGDKELPISRSYKQSVMAYLNEFLPSKRSAATNHGTK